MVLRGVGGLFETHGTAWPGKRVPPEISGRVTASLAEGLGMRAAARVFEVDPHPVLAWWIEAADPLEAFSQALRHDGQVSQVQLDERCAVLHAVKAGQLTAAGAIERLECSPHWVWVATDPVSKLLLALDVGERRLAMAQRLVHRGVRGLAPGCVPLVRTEGVKEDTTALLTHGGQWLQPPRRRAIGPTPTPRWMPLPERRYAQVGKTYRRRRLGRVSHRGIGGTLEGVPQGLASQGWHLNTAFIARGNGTMRPQGAAVGRRVITLGNSAEGWRPQRSL